MKTDDLILEIQSLPVEERARVADCILRSLNQTVSEVDQKWADLAARRLQAFRLATSSLRPVQTFLLRSGVGLIDADS
jgi:hypothetical protein